MENITFQTPAGHSVTIKPSLSYPEKRRVQRIILSGGRIDPTTKEAVFDMGVQIDASDALLKIMVQRLQLASGKSFEGGEGVIFNALSEMDEPDIQAIYDKVNELTKDIDLFPTAERGKKGGAGQP